MLIKVYCCFSLSIIHHTHTYTHPFNGPFSGTTRVSRYQKGKTNPDFTEPRDSEWQWHQLGHMQVCTSLQTDNHASTPPLKFFYRPDALPGAQPTASKHWRHWASFITLWENEQWSMPAGWSRRWLELSCVCTCEDHCTGRSCSSSGYRLHWQCRLLGCQGHVPIGTCLAEQFRMSETLDRQFWSTVHLVSVLQQWNGQSCNRETQFMYYVTVVSKISIL